MLQSLEYLEYEFEGGIMEHFLVPHPSGFALLNEEDCMKYYISSFAYMAEKEGFEPSVGINLHTLSKRAP